MAAMMDRQGVLQGKKTSLNHAGDSTEKVIKLWELGGRGQIFVSIFLFCPSSFYLKPRVQFCFQLFPSSHLGGMSEWLWDAELLAG